MVAGGADVWMGGTGTAASAGLVAGPVLYLASASDACQQQQQINCTRE